MATNNSIKNYELVEWTDDLNRGIEIIDQQHKHWICILNKLIKVYLKIQTYKIQREKTNDGL